MESILQRLGSCGCFQICFVLLIQALRIAANWSLSLMMFGNYEPPWQCVKYIKHINGTFPNTNATLSAESSFYQINSKSGQSDSTTKASISSLGNGSHQSIAWILRSSIDSKNNTSAIFYKGTCDLLTECDDVIFDPTSVTLVSDFRLICDQAYIPSAVIAAQMLGVLVGSSLSGQFGESFGRKKNNYAFMIFLSVAVFASSWSTSWQMLIGLFFIIGVGGGGLTVSVQVYTMEFLNARWRGRVGATPVGTIAILLFACTVLVLRNWRQVHLMCGAIGGLSVLGALWIPESLRWLHVHGREDECKKVISLMMKYNRRKGDVNEVLEILREQNTEDETSSGRRYTYLDLFRTSKIRALTIKGGIIWFAVLTSYYTLNFSVKALSGDYYINIILFCASEFPFAFLFYLSVNKLGRKFTLSLFILLSSVSCLACVVVFYTTSQEVSGAIIKYLAITAKASAVMTWQAMAIYCPELFPTVVRNLAMGFFSTVSRIGVILGTILIPRDQDSLVICFFALGGILVVAFVIVLTLPETKNKPLDDTITDLIIQKKRRKETDVLQRDTEEELRPTVDANVVESTLDKLT